MSNPSQQMTRDSSDHGGSAGTTQDLSPAAVKARSLVFGGFIGTCLLMLVIAAVWVSVYKSRLIKIPWPHWREGAPWPSKTRLCLSIGVGLLAAAGVVVFTLEHSDNLMRAMIAFAGALLAAGAIKFAIGDSIVVTDHVVWRWDARSDYHSGRQSHRSDEHRFVFESKLEPIATNPVANPADSDLVAPDDSDVAAPDEPAAPFEPWQLHEARVKAAWSEHQRSFDGQRNFRSKGLFLLFILYVGFCVGLPVLYAQTSSCQNGFYWEEHMVFFAFFCCTKVVELVLYTTDPSIDGLLPSWQFLFLFIASFLSFTDGYQDATAIQIAKDCGITSSPDINTALSQTLFSSMSTTFIYGVVVLQWGLLGCASLWDPSGACIARLLHMDTIAASISVPNDKMWLWYAISAARTLGEDIPQASQQAVFVTYVKNNWFMILSIGFSVLCSLKSLYDAVMRVSSAIGAYANAINTLELVEVDFKGCESARTKEVRVALPPSTPLREACDIARMQTFLRNPGTGFKLEADLSGRRRGLSYEEDGDRTLADLGIVTGDCIELFYIAASAPDEAQMLEPLFF